MDNRREHWDNIYRTKEPCDVSWTQEKPSTSLRLIESLQLRKHQPIIDVGGGDSLLVDHLLEHGYTDITVLDISPTSLEKAKKRLGKLAKHIHWIVADIKDFYPTRKYSLWHDRAAFHFLHKPEQITHYLNLVDEYAQHLIMGTFSTDGPLKCSGLEVKQYNEQQMKELLPPTKWQTKIQIRQDHRTPSGAKQNFIFSLFSKV